MAVNGKKLVVIEKDDQGKPDLGRREDHQALQSMYHFRVAPGARPGTMADLYLVREIKPHEMDLPIRNRR